MNPIGQQEDTDGPDPGKSKARMNPSEKAENAAYYGRETSRFDGEFTNYEDGEEDPFHASLGEAGDDAERGPRKDRETEDRSRSDPEKKQSGLLPGISRLAKHSFTMEDLLLAGIILLLLNGDGDSDLLLILGFLLLTGL